MAFVSITQIRLAKAGARTGSISVRVTPQSDTHFLIPTFDQEQQRDQVAITVPTKEFGEILRICDRSTVDG
jgi:hypothetical protein